MANVTLKIGERVTITATPLDGDGLPGTIDSPPEWTSDVAGVVNLAVAADGLSVEATAVADGTTNIVASATSDGGANSFSSEPVVTDVTPGALNPATQLAVTVGPVQPPITGRGPGARQPAAQAQQPQGPQGRARR